MTNRRSNAPTPFRAKNNQGAKDLFRNRKKYKEEAFIPIEDDDEPPVFDLWYDKYFYGKLNPKYHALVIDEDLLKRLSSNTTEKFAIDFVADAFNDLREFMIVSANKGKVSLESPTFLRMEPATAYTSFSKEYSNHISNLYFEFANIYLKENNREQKVRDFSSFMNVFSKYLNETVADVPLSQTGFLKSKYCSIFTTGLVIELADADHGDDVTKYNRYLNDINFIYYIQAADKFGFRIDKNAPWRLIADLKSKKMQEYMAKYPQKPDGPEAPGAQPILQDPQVIFEPYLKKQFFRRVPDGRDYPGVLDQIIEGQDDDDLEKRREAKFVILDNPPLQEPPNLESYSTTPVAKIDGQAGGVSDVILVTLPDQTSITDGYGGADRDSDKYQNKYWYLNKEPGRWGIRLSSRGSSIDPSGGQTTYIWKLVEGPRTLSWTRTEKNGPELVFYPDQAGYTYKFSLTTRYESGIASRPVFAEIKVCGMPWGGDLQVPSMKDDPKISRGDRIFAAASSAKATKYDKILKKWIFGSEKSRRGPYDRLDHPPRDYGWITNLKNVPITAFPRVQPPTGDAEERPNFQKHEIITFITDIVVAHPNNYGFQVQQGGGADGITTEEILHLMRARTEARGGGKDNYKQGLSPDSLGIFGCNFPYLLRTNNGDRVNQYSDDRIYYKHPNYREWCRIPGPPQHLEKSINDICIKVIHKIFENPIGEMLVRFRPKSPLRRRLDTLTDFVHSLFGVWYSRDPFNERNRLGQDREVGASKYINELVYKNQLQERINNIIEVIDDVGNKNPAKKAYLQEMRILLDMIIRLKRKIKEVYQNKNIFDEWWKNWQIKNFETLEERFTFSGSVEQPYPPHPEESSDTRGGYTYGAHGFANYNCPDVNSTSTEDAGDGAVDGRAVQLPPDLLGNQYNGPLQKTIIDFDFPKIISGDRSDIEFQKLRTDYRNNLENYSRQLTVWNEKKQALDRYNEISKRWDDIRVPISFDNMFNFYYTESYLTDLEMMKSIIPDFYNSFAIQNPFFNVTTFNCSLDGTNSRVKARSLISRDEITLNYDDVYWLKLYLTLRIKESMTRMSANKQQQIFEKIKFLARNNSRDFVAKTLKLIEDLTKTVKNNP